MFANSLTREASLMVGPVILDVLVKHHFDRLKKDAERSESESSLKQDDLLYHEAFTIVKSFLNTSTFHTIEELQAFSNTRTPSSPWTHVVRTLVPISCCEEAATYLIKALGGEEVARRLVGGVKWWQVRGVNGIDAQWITAKKDWQDAKRKYKKRQEQRNGPSTTDDVKEKSEGVYENNMDAMRCILFLHGGGYYFGSVDQERYSMQRFARKINGRVFAINYRLAPQYPFPCALQDAVAAYIYLIRPPLGSAHQAVDPAHIIIAGDSAGGGLSLALLQTIRDSDLPPPAGGVLISPWCDLTHSFPSVHVNTDTDIIPESGLSFHKPSLLWPPPSQEISSRVHASLRFRIRQAFRSDESPRPHQESTISEAQDNIPSDLNLNTPMSPLPPIDREKVVVQTESGEAVEINQQIQFYTRNSLLRHPLVSPAMSYLGGLPPLLFLAGDKEVLRDEVIYSAHKATYPEKYPIKDEVRELYPSLNDIEKRCKPTSVHLQVYDDSPHILPVLFSFTNPAKFCFRAVASFCKLVTEITPIPVPSSSDLPDHTLTSVVTTPPITRRQSLFAGFKSSPRASQTSLLSSPSGVTLTDSPQTTELEPMDIVREKPSIKRSLSVRFSRTGNGLLGRQVSVTPPPSIGEAHPGRNPLLDSNVTLPPTTSSDVGGPRFQRIQTSPPSQMEPGERTAGDMSVYSDIKDIAYWECRMIRERVATTGITRPLEMEHELDATQLPAEHVGKFSEQTTQRYLKYRGVFDKKFAHTVKTIDKNRVHNLERARQDTIKRLSILRHSLTRDGKAAANGHSKKQLKDNILLSPGWGWAWALDEAEDPPPSSIVSRRDTEEARKLAEVADQAVMSEDQTFSGNNLWSVVINFLTTTPGKQNHALHDHRQGSTNSISGTGPSSSGGAHGPERHKSRSKLSSLFKRHAPTESDE